MALAASAALQASAQNWDPVPGVAGPGNGTIDGGSGIWDAATANWTSDNGATNAVWTSGGSAIFGGNSAGMVTIVGTLSAGSLQFDSAGGWGSPSYTLASQSLADILTLSGAASTITTNQDAFISANLAGTAGFAKLGTYALTLSGVNTFSGTVAVNAGTLVLAGSQAAGTSTITVNSNATLINSAQAVNSAVKLAGGTLSFATDSATYGGAISLAANSTILLPVSGKTMTLSGVVSGTNAVTIDGAGGGALAITNASNFNGSANTFTGSVSLVSSGAGVGSAVLGYRINAPSGQILSASSGTLTLGNSISGASIKINDGSVVQSTGGTIQLYGRASAPGVGVTVNGDLSASGGGQILVGDGADDSAQLQFATTCDLTMAGGTITLRPRATALTFDSTTVGTITMQDGGMLALAGNADFTLNRAVSNPSGTWILANQSPNLFRIVPGTHTAGLVLRADSGTLRYDTASVTIGTAQAEGTLNLDLRGGTIDINNTTAGATFNYASGYTLSGSGQIGTSATNQTHVIASGGATFYASGSAGSVLSIVGGFNETAGGKAAFRVGNGNSLLLNLPTTSLATAYRINSFSVDSQAGTNFARLLLPAGYAWTSGSAITGAANKLRFEISGGTLVSDLTSTGTDLLTGGTFGASIPILVSNGGTYISTASTFTLASSEYLGTSGTLFGYNGTTATALTLNGLVELNGTIGGSVSAASTGTFKLNAGSTLTLGAAADLSAMTLAYAGSSGAAILQLNAPSATARIGLNTGITPYGTFGGTRQFTVSAGTLQIDSAAASTVSISGTNTLVIDRTNDSTNNPTALGTLLLDGGAFQVGTTASTTTVGAGAMLYGRGSYGHTNNVDTFINNGTVMASSAMLIVYAGTSSSTGIRGTGAYVPNGQTIALLGSVQDIPGTPTQLRVVGNGAGGKVDLVYASGHTGGTVIDGSAGNVTLRQMVDGAMGTGPITINCGTLTFISDLSMANSGKTPPITITGTGTSSITFSRYTEPSSVTGKVDTIGAVTVNAPTLAFVGQNSYTLSMGALTAGSNATAITMNGASGGATINASSLALNGTLALDIAGVTFTTGKLSGAGNFTRTVDSGTLTLNTAANGFTGNVTLLGGTTNFNSGSNILLGGTYFFGGKNIAINSGYALNGATGTIAQSNAAGLYVNLNAANALSGTTASFSSGNVYGNVSNALGTGVLNMTGGSLWLWNDPSTSFGGTVNISGSNITQIYVDHSKSSTGLNGTHSLSILTLQNANLQLTGSNGYSLTVTGGISVSGSSASSLTQWANNLTTPTLTLGNNLTVSGSGPISIGSLGGSGSLSWTNAADITITGAAQAGYTGSVQLPIGNLNLNAANAVAGGSVAVSGGSLNAGAAGALGGATVSLSSGFVNANVSGALNGATVQVTNGTIMAPVGNALGNAAISMTGGNITATAANGLGGANITMNGAILAMRSDSSAAFGGTLTITGTNTVTLSSGPITTEFGPTGNTLTLNQLSLGGQVVNITGSNDYIFAVANPVAMSGTAVTTFNATAADALFQGALTGTCDLVKNGVRTVTLNGGASYGATTINNGALIVNGAFNTTGVTIGSNTAVGLLQMGGGGTNTPGNLTVANGTLRIAKANPADAVPLTSQISAGSSGNATVEYAGLASGTSQGVLGNNVAVNLSSAARTLTISSASGSSPNQPSNFLWSGLVTTSGSNALSVVYRADPPADDGFGNLVRSPSRLIVSGAQTFNVPVTHGGGIVIAKGSLIPNGGANNPLGWNTASLALNVPDSTIGGMVADGQTAATFSRNITTTTAGPRQRLGAFYNPSGGTATQTVTFTASMAWNDGSLPLFGVIPAGNPAGAMANSTWNGFVVDPQTVLQFNSGAILDNVLTAPGGTIATTAPIYIGGGGTVRFNTGFDETSYRNLAQAKGLSGTAIVLDNTTLQSLTAGHSFDGVDLCGGTYQVGSAIQAMSGGFAVDPSPINSTIVSSNLITDSNFTLNGTGTARALRIAAGQTLIKSGAGIFTVNSDQANGAGSTLRVDAGTVNLNTDGGMNGGAAAVKNLSIVANNASVVNLNTTQHLAGIAVGSNAIVKVATSGTIGGKVLTITGASTSGTGKIDLTNNNAIWDYTGGSSPISTIRSMLASGYNDGGTHWTGSGIISSSAAANSTMAIGYAESSTILGPSGGSLWGETVNGTSVLMKYTKAGDADLSGTVDFTDLVAVAQHYNMASGATWSVGDFNYDGKVDFADLVAVAQNYGQTAASDPVPGATASFSTDWQAALASVPEPGSMALAAVIAGLALMRRRRRPARR